MYIFLYRQSSGNVINLIVFYFINTQKENNVFDWKEYIKALKEEKNNFAWLQRSLSVSTVQQCKKILLVSKCSDASRTITLLKRIEANI